MAKQQKNWKFTPTDNYYKDLAMRESSGFAESRNEDTNYIGLYQMGELALIDAGYYTKPIATKHNDWTGTWTGKHGIKSIDDFLHNSLVQEIAIREYHKIIWENYLKNYHQYEGKTIGGIELTKAGMISASHLVGHAEVKNFINSNGRDVKADGNGTLCTDYLKSFGNYDLDYATAELQKQLEEQAIAKQQEQNTNQNLQGATGLNIMGSDYDETPEYSGTFSMQKAVNQSYRLMLQKRGLVDNSFAECYGSILQALDQSDKQIDAMAPTLQVMMQQAQNEMRKSIGVWQTKQNRPEEKSKNIGSFLLNMATQGHLSDSDTELNLAGNNEELD